MTSELTAPEQPQPGAFRIVTLNYVSLYVHDLPDAVNFYARVFGPPEYVEADEAVYGFRLGATWLTLFPSSAGPAPGSNPRNTEFAIQVSDSAEVDRLHQALLAAGARNCRSPCDTRMYEPMRFGCVDDPFGVRVSIYAPLTPAAPP
jgi:catechol 2,3-dioxygenase-like lactoylglutathione lyase family enzyme